MRWLGTTALIKKKTMAMITLARMIKGTKGKKFHCQLWPHKLRATTVLIII